MSIGKFFGRNPAAGRHRDIPEAERKQRQEAAYHQARKEAKDARAQADGSSKAAGKAAVAAALAPSVQQIANHFASKPIISGPLNAISVGLGAAPALQQAREKPQPERAQVAKEAERRAQVQKQLMAERDKHAPARTQNHEAGRHRRGS